MSSDSPAPAFDEFWAASELSRLNRRRFAERMAAYAPAPSAIDPWSRPAAGTPAERLSGSLADLLSRRRSVRRFARDPISTDELGRLLSVLAGPEPGRGYPAAGGLYAIRAICLVFSADRHTGRILQHDPIQHSLTPVGECPGWAELVDDLAGQDAETEPAAVIGLFADSDATLEKYGERAGRFLLIEAGAAVQSLALAAVDLGLVGYPAGGASDRRMLGIAGLAGMSARYVISYVVGRMEPTP